MATVPIYERRSALNKLLPPPPPLNYVKSNIRIEIYYFPHYLISNAKKHISFKAVKYRRTSIKNQVWRYNGSSTKKTLCLGQFVSSLFVDKPSWCTLSQRSSYITSYICISKYPQLTYMLFVLKQNDSQVTEVLKFGKCFLLLTRLDPGKWMLHRWHL